MKQLTWRVVAHIRSKNNDKDRLFLGLIWLSKLFKHRMVKISGIISLIDLDDFFLLATISGEREEQVNFWRMYL